MLFQFFFFFLGSFQQFFKALTLHSLYSCVPSSDFIFFIWVIELGENIKQSMYPI